MAPLVAIAPKPIESLGVRRGVFFVIERSPGARLLAGPGGSVTRAIQVEATSGVVGTGGSLVEVPSERDVGAGAGGAGCVRRRRRDAGIQVLMVDVLDIRGEGLCAVPFNGERGIDATALGGAGMGVREAADTALINE